MVKNRGKILQIYKYSLIAYYCVLLLTVTTLLSPEIRNLIDYGRAGIILMSPIVALATIIVTQEYQQEKNKRLYALQLFTICCTVVVPLISQQAMQTWVMILIAMSCSGLKEKEILKPCIVCGSVITLLVFALSILGIIENNRGNSFGFIYRTHYACYLLCLAMAYCIYKGGKLSWKGELGLIGLFLYNLFFVGGKTCALLMSALIAITFLHHYREGDCVPFQGSKAYGIFKVLYVPIKVLDKCSKKIPRCNKLLEYIFPICAAFSFFLALTYWKFEKFYNMIPWFDSLKARLLYGHITFLYKPLSLFGVAIPQRGQSFSNGIVDLYYAIDCGYVKVLLEYGIVPFIILMALFVLAQKRLIKADRRYTASLLVLFAIDNMIEYWMIWLCYDLFVIFAMCELPKGEDS